MDSTAQHTDNENQYSAMAHRAYGKAPQQYKVESEYIGDGRPTTHAKYKVQNQGYQMQENVQVKQQPPQTVWQGRNGEIPRTQVPAVFSPQQIQERPKAALPENFKNLKDSFYNSFSGLGSELNLSVELQIAKQLDGGEKFDFCDSEQCEDSLDNILNALKSNRSMKSHASREYRKQAQQEQLPAIREIPEILALSNQPVNYILESLQFSQAEPQQHSNNYNMCITNIQPTAQFYESVSGVQQQAPPIIQEIQEDVEMEDEGDQQHSEDENQELDYDEEDDLGDCGDDDVPTITHTGLQPEQGFQTVWH